MNFTNFAALTTPPASQTKLAGDGSALTWSSYLGSNSTQSAVTGLVVDNTGVVYSVGNAIYQATGKRLRSLPMVPDGMPTV